MKPAETTRRSMMFVLVLVSMALPVSVMATDTGDRLRRAMADISLLNSQITQRKADAAGIRDGLSAQFETIQGEAQLVMKGKGIRTEAEALSNPRIWYDLMLMAEIRAYIDRYSQKIAYYRVACDRLSYLYQQADDDLKIVSTLSDMKIDALISQAEKVLDGYLPDAQTIVIQPGTMIVEPPEKVWKILKSRK